MSITVPFDNSYARLPAHFFAKVAPGKVRASHIVKVNRALAEELGLDPEQLASEAGAEVLAGNSLFSGSEPIALAYAGHQFGSFVPQLGDGRAILLGEVLDRAGHRRDIQLKGSGRTPFSRGGDGRAALGPVLREYIVSEAMAALGVPTTRALAAVTTGELVMRDEPLPGAILTRVASSHLRVGTFQFFAARNDRAALETLASYALERHYPTAMGSRNDALALIENVIAAQARLVARWLGVGFVHGVMNTDNTSIAGETIDYGPCAFLDAYDPKKVFSSIDRRGRYAFGQQPAIAQWNCTRLAEALLPLLADEEEAAVALATERLRGFTALFGEAYAAVMRVKLGLTQARHDDQQLAADLLERMAASGVDFTSFFRGLCGAAEDSANDEGLASSFDDPAAFHTWAETWRARLRCESATPQERASAMRLVNPAFIPRNHRIEEAIQAAVLRGDFQPFETLTRLLEHPYLEQPELAYLATPPLPSERVEATFCGT